MTDTLKKNPIAAAALAFVLILLVAGLVFVMVQYAFVGGRFYSRSQYVYDLRGRNITEETYAKLEKRLPDSWIIWDVPFQDGTVSSDAKEISVTSLTDEDVDHLDYMKNLQVLHGENCGDCFQLAEAKRRHPDCDVRYFVNIGGESYPQDTTQIALTELSAEDVLRLECLTELSGVDVTNCYEYDLLESLKQEHPEWNLNYTIHISDNQFSREAKSITANGGTYPEIKGALKVLKDLKSVMLVNPEATGEELVKLQEEFPNVTLHWKMELNGMEYADDSTEVDISGNVMSVDDAKEIAAHFPKLEKLIMSDCGIPNEEMAEFREEMRGDYKVVWTVYFTEKCKARTDDTIFMPIKQGEYYFNNNHVGNLKYLEDLVCMDIGHAPVKQVEFLKYMPKLEYLILAHTDVRDISPISYCKSLRFLELDWSPAPDFTPLLECTSLEDLNIGNTFADWRPIMQMTWLKNLWVCERKSTGMQQGLREALTNTHLEFAGSYTVGNGWRKLPNYYAMRDMLGMPYME